MATPSTTSKAAKAAKASSSPATASDAATAPDAAPTSELAADAKPEASTPIEPIATNEQSAPPSELAGVESKSSEPAPDVEPEAGPIEPEMPKAPEQEPELRTDGPTLAEFIAAGYPAESYPPQGYAAKPEGEVRIEHYLVTEHCRYFQAGVMSTWPKGHVIDSLNYNIADVKAQGLPIEPCDVSAKNLMPSIGHWSR